MQSQQMHGCVEQSHSQFISWLKPQDNCCSRPVSVRQHCQRTAQGNHDLYSYAWYGVIRNHQNQGAPCTTEQAGSRPASIFPSPIPLCLHAFQLPLQPAYLHLSYASHGAVLQWLLRRVSFQHAGIYDSLLNTHPAVQAQ